MELLGGKLGRRESEFFCCLENQRANDIVSYSRYPRVNNNDQNVGAVCLSVLVHKHWQSNCYALVRTSIDFRSQHRKVSPHHFDAI